MVSAMLRSGTAWPWMLLLFGSACGDSVVVARGVSLVSAAESSDAGVWDARVDDEHPSDAGHAGAPNHHQPNTSHGTGGTGGTGGGSSSSSSSSDNSKHH